MSSLPNRYRTVLLAASLSSTAASASHAVHRVAPRVPSTATASPERPYPPPVAPQHSPAAAHATQLLISILTTLSSTAEITPERIGKQFDGTLTHDEGSLAYRSSDLGKGWIYGVKVTPPKKTFKAGFGFWFYNPDYSADPSTVCSLTMATLRQNLIASGFVEKSSPSEIGGIDWVNFVKNDIWLTVTRRDVVQGPGESLCVMSLQTDDNL